MSVQYPPLSQPEQQERVSRMAKDTLFPFSYPFQIIPTVLNFTGTALNSKSVMTLGFQADNNMAISSLEVQYSFATVFTQGTAHNFVTMLEVSYSPIIETNYLSPSGVPPVPTPVPDKGNIIYRNITQNVVAASTNPPTVQVNDFRRYEPYNYLVKFNQIVYIHFLLDTEVLAGSGFWQGIVNFHGLVTGEKS